MSASMAEVLRELLEEVWDDGNAMGLDGWIGPGRGAGEVDDEALHARERVIQKAAEQLAANGYGKLPEPTWNPDKALVGPKKCNGCGNEIKGGSRHGFCSGCLGDEW